MLVSFLFSQTHFQTNVKITPLCITNDINENGNPDFIGLTGETLHRDIHLFEIVGDELVDLWHYSISNSKEGEFVSAAIGDYNNDGTVELIIVSNPKNSSDIFYVFEIQENVLGLIPTAILPFEVQSDIGLNPLQIVPVDWNGDGHDEFAFSIGNPQRHVYICNYQNKKINIIEEVGSPFVSDSYGQIMLSSVRYDINQGDDLLIINNSPTPSGTVVRADSVYSKDLRFSEINRFSFVNPNGQPLLITNNKQLFQFNSNNNANYLHPINLDVEDISQAYMLKGGYQSSLITVHSNKIGCHPIVLTDTLTFSSSKYFDIEFDKNIVGDISSIFFDSNQLLVYKNSSNFSAILYDLSSASLQKLLIADHSKFIINIGEEFVYPISFEDSLVLNNFSIFDTPTGMNYNVQNKQIEWTPSVNQIGKYFISSKAILQNSGYVSISENDSLWQYQLIETAFEVLDSIEIYVNDKPKFIQNKVDWRILEGESGIKNINVIDNNEDANLLYSISSNILAEIDQRGNIYVNAEEAKPGQYEILTLVTDGYAIDSLSLDVNIHPIIQLTDNQKQYICKVGEETIIPISTKQEIGSNTYLFSLSESPENMRIDEKGIIRWIPMLSQVDDNSCIVSVSDQFTTSEIELFFYVNNTPLISSRPAEIDTVDLHSTFEFQCRSFDLNVDAQLSWFLPFGHVGMELDSLGVFTWTPDSLGLFNYTISLQDNYSNTDFTGSIYVKDATIHVEPEK